MSKTTEYILWDETKTASEYRYLLCTGTFTEKFWEVVKKQVANFMKTRPKDNLHHAFMKWHPKQNEIAVLTLYAYADIALPKKYEVVFQITNPENYTKVDFEIVQSVFDGWAAINSIGHGHKHVNILKFDSQIPPIFLQLKAMTKGESFSRDTHLGFCMKEDFEAIKNRLLFPEPSPE